MGTAGMTLADLSNIFIMVAALAVFFVMLLILLRNMAIVGVVGAETGEMLAWGASGAAPRPPRLLMQRVHIPFTFKLTNTNHTSYSEVRCAVSSAVRYTQVCWWGAPVRELHAALWLPLHDVLSDTRHTLAAHTSLTTPLARCGAHSEREVTLRLEAPLSLGGPPRTCYPLVVMLARVESDTAHLRPDDTVALVSVVHIQDPTCPLPSGVLAQYLKQANGQLSCLKQLYVSGEGVVEGGAYEGAAAAAEGALCCVCTARPLSRALLPCRHACLCSSCFPKLDKCPICRSGISSYFCIRGEEEAGGGGGGAGAAAGKRPARWPVSLHNRLLDLFPYH